MTTYLFFKELYRITLEGNGARYLKGRHRKFIQDLWFSAPFERCTGRQLDIYDQL